MEKVIETLGIKMPQIIQNSDNSVILDFKVPYINQQITCDHVDNMDNLIAYNREQLIKCIEERMKHCVQDLLGNLHNVCNNDGFVIIYKYKDSYKHFSIPSYKAMEDLVNALKAEIYTDYNLLMYDQLLKAVISYGKSYDVRNYDGMISYLLYEFKESEA